MRVIEIKGSKAIVELTESEIADIENGLGGADNEGLIGESGKKLLSEIEDLHPKLLPTRATS